MSLQDANGFRTGLESNDPAVRRGPMSELKNILAYVGTYIQEQLTGSYIHSQERSHILLVILIDQSA
jgi:hypothetical protein